MQLTKLLTGRGDLGKHDHDAPLGDNAKGDPMSKSGGTGFYKHDVKGATAAGKSSGPGFNLKSNMVLDGGGSKVGGTGGGSINLPKKAGAPKAGGYKTGSMNVKRGGK